MVGDEATRNTGVSRSRRIICHLIPSCCADIPPAPPIAELEEGVIFPTFPQLLETRKRLGGVFTYNIYGGHRMTFIADPAVWRLVFYAKGSDDTKLESEKLAYVWFGIDKQVLFFAIAAGQHCMVLIGCPSHPRRYRSITLTQASRPPARQCTTTR